MHHIAVAHHPSPDVAVAFLVLAIFLFIVIAAACIGDYRRR